MDGGRYVIRAKPKLISRYMLDLSHNINPSAESANSRKSPALLLQPDVHLRSHYPANESVCVKKCKQA